MAKKKKTKAKPKAKTKPKAKAKLKAKAKPKTKAKAKVKAKAKPKAKATRPVAKPQPQILDEVIEQSLVDVSGILRVKDAVARSQRDRDEDELKQFSDPSLVVEVQQPRLPSLFADEARRQDETPSDVSPKPRDGSLFGSLGSSSEDDADDEPDED